MDIFLGSEIQQPDENKAFFHIIPVPLEHSVSYGAGTKLGVETIIKASSQLETFDGIDEPCGLGIYTHQPINCDDEIVKINQQIRQKTHSIAQKKQLPFVIGGEHTVSYGAILGIADAYPLEKIGVIQFDAHADLRDCYENSRFSHACVMKRVVDEGIDLLQLGVRAISVEEINVRGQNPDLIRFFDAQVLCKQPVHKLKIPDNFPKKVYVTVDIDGLDGSIMPATGTPVAGGFSFWQLIDLLNEIAIQREIVGMDLVEFAPIANFHSYDFLAADLAYKMMGIAGRSRKN